MKIKPLAFYLPQYHPIPENDSWWGKGFTEWTNVGKAKPLFKGHYQPLIPQELGYYDLRVPEILEQQAHLAREFGIYGFIFYHYWFGNGKQLLQKIPERMLETGKPDFPYCFCWANETWSGIWHGLDKKILAEQKYLGEEDVEKHIEYLAPFFDDDRYIKIDGMPVFIIYDPSYISSKEYIEFYRKYAKRKGFRDLYIIGSSKTPDNLNYQSLGYDAHISNAFHISFNTEIAKWKRKIPFFSKWKRNLNGPIRVPAKKVFSKVKLKEANVETYPMVLPNWDNTPRSGRRGIVLEGSTPRLFEGQLLNAGKYLVDKKNYREKFLIIKSWNEWAEGNILEPEQKFGSEYLQRLRDVLTKLEI